MLTQQNGLFSSLGKDGRWGFEMSNILFDVILQFKDCLRANFGVFNNYHSFWGRGSILISTNLKLILTLQYTYLLQF